MGDYYPLVAAADAYLRTFEVIKMLDVEVYIRNLYSKLKGYKMHSVYSKIILK